MTRSDQPDILFITIDSLRADHVGWLGYERDTTPNLDELAKESYTFSNAFSHACQTPFSFPSILTSTYAMMYGGGKKLSSERTLISETLSDNGYTTAGFHSNPYLSDEFGYERGYDRYYDSIQEKSVLADIRQFVRENLDSSGHVYQFLKRAFEITERSVGVEVGSPFVDAKTLTDLAIQWLEEDSETPSYLWAHYMDIHHPYLPPEEHQLAIRGETISDRKSVKLRRRMLEEPEALTEKEHRKIVDLYDAEVRYTDAEIGRLIEAARSERNNVMTVVTSDHGEELGEHGGYSHHMPKFLDEYIHVPLLIHSPDVPKGTSEETVGLLDVAPTLADYAGVSPPDDFVGNSLETLIEDDPWERNHVIAEWQKGRSGDRNFCYRDEEWTYIRRENGAHHPDQATAESEELYKVAARPDPDNVISRYPQVAEELREVIDRHVNFVDRTEAESGDVEMSDEVQQRLRDLGYQE